MSFKLLLLQLGFTCSTASESYDLYSQILSVYERSIEVSLFFLFFFLGCFCLKMLKSADIYEKYLFLVFFGATDGNFTEKYSVTPS